MKVSPPPPRSSAIGPLGTTSYVEQSVTCLHCQKVHDRGFIWNFSDTVRVCFTCYREMGEDGRKSYEREAAKGGPTSVASQTTASKGIEARRKGYAMPLMGILALLIVILGASSFYLHKPLTSPIAEHRVHAGESRMHVKQ